MYLFDYDWLVALAGLAWALMLSLSLRLTDLLCGLTLLACLLGGFSLYQDVIQLPGERLATALRALPG